jgi:hypothetical protein
MSDSIDLALFQAVVDSKVTLAKAKEARQNSLTISQLNVL